MDARTILRIKPALTRYLHDFDGCMGRVTNRRHLRTYVAGQLSDLQRKSVEPIADAAGQPPRTLQQFLGLLQWDEEAVRDRLQRRVAQRHPHPHVIGIPDETSFAKQGNQTACVQRQHCGSRGKQDYCVVAVHLGYAAGDFHTLLDGELYLPEMTWHGDLSPLPRGGYTR
jgi:SRSO17 transposase